MNKSSSTGDIAIRPALARDADGITHIYLESAEYHAGLDAERYRIPDAQEIAARYREGRQHSPNTSEEAITLVAEMGGEIVGFVDARLTRSPDPMHREMIYCHIVEIAVSSGYQGQGVGEQLLRATEDWGRRRDAEFASLEFLAANHRARGFYERLAYRAGSIIAIKRL